MVACVVWLRSSTSIVMLCLGSSEGISLSISSLEKLMNARVPSVRSYKPNTRKDV